MKVRFVPKATGQGRSLSWSPYDTFRASYPVALPTFGRVKTGFKTEAECQPECDNLNEFFKGVSS